MSKARAKIIDAAALWYEIDPEAVEVAPFFAFGDDLPRILDQSRKARVEYSQVEDQVRALTDAVASELLQRDMSMRDAAEILGLAHQRVQQIAAQVCGRSGELDQGGQPVNEQRASSEVTARDIRMTLAHLNVAEARVEMSPRVPLLMAIRDKLALALREDV